MHIQAHSETVWAINNNKSCSIIAQKFVAAVDAATSSRQSKCWCWCWCCSYEQLTTPHVTDLIHILSYLSSSSGSSTNCVCFAVADIHTQSHAHIQTKIHINTWANLLYICMQLLCFCCCCCCCCCSVAACCQKVSTKVISISNTTTSCAERQHKNNQTTPYPVKPSQAKPS